MKTPITPQEIFEYKRNWLPNGFQVDVHSDLDVQCKDWCRKHLERYQWSMSSWTGVYSHSFFFETLRAAEEFHMEFIDWVNKGK